ESILLRVSYYPAKRAKAILDCGGSERYTSETIFDIHDIPSHLHVRQKTEQCTFLVTASPTAAMNPDQRRLGRRDVCSRIDVQFGFKVVRRQVRDVRNDAIRHRHA